MINWLKIENFKSIKKQSLKTKRINVFIGKPNVGKSNILEAISLLGGYNSTMRNFANKEKFMGEFVRYENYSNLFYDNDRSEKLIVNSNIGFCYSKYHLGAINSYELVFGPNLLLVEAFLNEQITSNFGKRHEEYKSISENYKIDSLLNDESVSPYYYSVSDAGSVADFDSYSNRFEGNIKRYEFKKGGTNSNRFPLFLKPTHGDNTSSMLEANPKIFDEIAEIFDQYGLQLLLDNQTNSLEVQKVVGKRVYKIPYSLCADTLQRYIFNLLAIKTNKESIIILEEPEAHSFPKYIVNIANEIIEDKSNQYFIATHSPYLLTDFIEKCEPEELGLFICDFKNYETTIRELSREEIINIKETGIDLFYNLPAFSE